METSVEDLGEDSLVTRLTKQLTTGPGVIVGPGDDCAIVESGIEQHELMLLKTDCLVERVHFLSGTDPKKVGWKAVCRVLSDIAAMGGEPVYALVTLAIEGGRSASEVEGWYQGMKMAAAEFGDFPIVGGETSSLPSPGAVISVALTGKVNRESFALRSGAEPGDLIAVTGKLGGSFSSGRHLSFRPRLEEAKWLMAREKQNRPTAMMDLSDGLASDLPRLAEQSGGLGFDIDFKAIPLHSDTVPAAAVGEGEDYELLITFPAANAEGLLADWKNSFPECPLTVIGKMRADTERTKLKGGWDHFSD